MRKESKEDVEEILRLHKPPRSEHMEAAIETTISDDTISDDKPVFDDLKLIRYEDAREKEKETDQSPHTIRLEDLHRCQEIRYGHPGLVKLDEVVVPSNLQVTEEYREMAVPEVSPNARNRLWRKAEVEGEPLLIIEKRKKYGNIVYDMLTVRHTLSNESMEKLRGVVGDFISSMSGEEFRTITERGSIGYSLGNATGYVNDIRLYEARILARNIKKVLVDKTSWVEIKNNPYIPQR